MNFDDPNFSDQWLQRKDNYQNIKEVLIHLAVCHTVIQDKLSGSFNGPSPDEVALVTAAKSLGVEFKEKNDKNMITLNC